MLVITPPDDGPSTTFISLPHSDKVFNEKYILNNTFVTANIASFFEVGLVIGVRSLAIVVQPRVKL